MTNQSSGKNGLVHAEAPIFTRSVPGRIGYSLPKAFGDTENAEAAIPEGLRRKEAAELPEVDEPTVVRHYTRLSVWNHSIDSGFYPLGSCTMKYNPRVNEKAVRLEGFGLLHPYAPEAHTQGAMRLIYELGRDLAEIAGFTQVTLQPAAGAHGELVGIKLIRAYHKAQGNPRKKILVPDTAHGTNPASCKNSGYKAVEVKSGPDGVLLPESVEKLMDENVAGLMVTNPNTLGLFEEHICEIAEIVHAKGGLVYCDGANLNSIMGVSRPGDMGIDVMHFNLHKTFSTPHGGGGPGSGPVGVHDKLAPFLPTPIINEKNGVYRWDYDRPQSIGRVKSFYGNFAVMVRAYAYIREMGAAGLKQASQMAVLNANYVRAGLESTYDLPYKTPSMHEVVFSDKHLEETGVTTLDVAKRLLDHGVHPPTVYFPLVVHGAIMIEPTETESKETLDSFIDIMKAISDEAKTNPEVAKAAPTRTVVGRLDETKAAREPMLRYKPDA
ncbi:MAG: aminomethyl-transferring glycine dehydrogenase subunit GcvPB [Deltaproteobacteria bacterium]|nr:aminomethyl-transferring glycine dehydrogenase subunit GcvPB [Deltaproteobacteria bacterium]